MPVTAVDTDTENLTLTITAEFAAPAPRVWQVYADPRQLEQIWGPPGYPATVVEHDLRVGGRVSYYLTSPEGEKHPGWWEFTVIDEPRVLGFDDGFSRQDLQPLDSLPVSHNTFTFAESEGRTSATFVSRYQSAEALQQVLDMGAIEGATAAINQVDDLLARDPA